MDQVKFVEDSLYQILREMLSLSRPYRFNFLKAIFHKFHVICS